MTEIHNSDIAAIFNRLADLLEIQGENVFRIRAYRTAALVVEGLPGRAADMVKGGEDLTQLPGIGKELAAKIAEIVSTGRLAALERLQAKVPAGLVEMMAIQGLGPRRVRALYEKLGVTDVAGLKKAASTQRVRSLAGFGQKTEEGILREIERLENVGGRMRLADAEKLALPLVAYLGKAKGVKRVVIAGSYRRAKEAVRDLDILVTCSDGAGAMEHFVKYDGIGKVVSRGETRSTALLRSGFQVDVRVVPEKSYGAALCYFTGSQAHNIGLRRIAKDRGMKLNEYGVFRVSGSGRETWIAGRTEEEVYRQLGLKYIEPELREDRGEIDAARAGSLPRLVTLGDIRGDLHVHTDATDGHNSPEEMIAAARDRGYEYVGITDHTKHVTIAHGLDDEAARRHIRKLERLGRAVKGITVLRGMEVDILEDGRLDLDDAVLAELDFTVCSVHYKFNLPQDRQTERVIRAMDNPHFNIFAHPTGRLIHERAPYEIDMKRIVSAARERGCVLELNGHPLRLDLNDVDCKLAKDSGAAVAVSTDSHSTADLDFMRFAVLQARRGWLEPEDVVNTRTLAGLRKLLKRA